MLTEGQHAPTFALPNAQGTIVRLGDYAGRCVVLYFYPRDLTPGCTVEAEQFQLHLPAIHAAGAEVIGISKDPPARHEKFAIKCALGFPLLSDIDGTVIEAYGAWKKKWLYGKTFLGIGRITYLIGSDGVICKAYPKVAPKTHAEEIVRDLQKLTRI